MNKKLWIDDIKMAPSGWDWAKTSAEAIKAIRTTPYVEISFDHDLGGTDTAYRVASLIEELAHSGKIKRMNWKVHSQNPVGIRNIQMAMQNADKYWNGNGTK